MTRDDSKCRICRRTIYTHFGEGHAFKSDKLSLRGEVAEAYKKYYDESRSKIAKLQKEARDQVGRFYYNLYKRS